MVKVTLKKQFGKRLTELRKAKGLSQEKLAELVNLSITSLSQIETGASFPKSETLEKFADVLKISMKDLFNFQESNLSEMAREINKKIKFLKRDRAKLTAIYNFVEQLM